LNAAIGADPEQYKAGAPHQPGGGYSHP